MSALLTAFAIGAVLVAGIFYAFSTFVMSALSRLEPGEGVRAMQAINVVVLNPWFLGAFLGTGLLALAAVAATWTDAGLLRAATSLAALLYIVGCVGVTGVRNVPLNNRLAEISSDTGDNHAVDSPWREYVDRWTRWNHVRTAASLGAGILILVAMQRA